MSNSETYSKAKPYGLFGLFLSLLAIIGLTALFSGLIALAVVWISFLSGESGFFASITTLIKRGPGGISAEAAALIGYALSYAIYGGLGLATLLAALFQARTARMKGRTVWAEVKALIAFEPPVFQIRTVFAALFGFIYGLTADLVLPRFYPAAADWVTLPQGTAKITALYILVVAAAPTVEELVFRGWIYTSLRASYGFWAALLVTAAFFAFLHYEQTHLYALAVFPLGLALGLMREWSGSIKPTIAFHAFYNFTVLTLGLLE